MSFDPGKLFYWMCKTYSENKSSENKIVICNEGGSRSSKTWGTFHFLFAICDQHRFVATPLQIGIFRRTLKDCREKTYEKDFKPCMQAMKEFNQSDSRKENTSPDYILFGNRIEFRGLDDNSEATGYDIIFINETLEVEAEYLIKGLKMRCKRLLICDWNPRYSAHWIFEWEKIPFTYFSHTTYLNNKHLPKSVISDIESTSPWNLEDLHLPEDKRRPHHENIKNGTVDKWYFLVYGMGIRANREGLVFPNVTWIDSFPEDISEISYGCDFGQANPTAIVKIGVRRNAIKSDLFIEKLFYASTETSDIVSEVIHQLAEKQIVLACEGKTFDHESQRLVFIQTLKDSDHYIPNKIWCDSNMGIEKGWISDLRNRNIQALATRKFPGSRDYWISTIKRYNIHMVKDVDLRKEQENFCYRVVDGIQLSETEKKHDHAWSATGYSTVGDFRIEE